MENIEKRYGRYPTAISRRSFEIKDYMRRNSDIAIEDVIKG